MPSSEQESAGSGTAQFPKLRAPADTRGVDYEERTLALTFLRCLRDNLQFSISSNNEAAGKFDDLVLRWRYNNSPDTYLLLAQLKHKSPTHGSSEVTRTMLLQPSGNNNRFRITLYQESYRRIKETMQTPNFTLLLSTNAALASDTRGMLVRRSHANVPGAEFLDTGGTLYGLNPNDEEVRRAVNNDHRFIEHFAIFCQQKDSEEIRDAICREIDILLAPREAEGYVYESLCREIREWKLNENLWLGEGWKKWVDIVTDYTEKFVCQCGDKSVRAPISFRGVDSIREFVNSRNPAFITPLRRSTAPLTASKLHQVVGGEPHLLLTARRYRQLRQQVLCVWERFCKWLVIIDDGPEDDTEIFEELTSQVSTSRHLVVVTSKRDSSFLDTFGSLEVTDECWRKFLEIKVRLNGDKYLCCLRDLVGDTGSLKILLDSRPEDVVTLSKISGTLDIGQHLDPVPEYHISRRVVVRRCVTNDFFLSLGEKEVCIINRASYPFVPSRAWSGVILDLRRLEIVLASPNRTWPLLTIAGDTDHSAFEVLRERYPDVCLYAFNYSSAGWQMMYFSGHSDRIQPYIKMQIVKAPEKLDISRGRIILEGAPGIGKSSMLSAVARHLKALDPAYWIVKVNFSEFYNIFDNCDNDGDALDHVLMHVTSADTQLGHLERTLLSNCLQHSPRVMCLVDGFDELTSAYRNLSLQVLKKLTPHKGGMLVTVRPTAKTYVEETLGSMACLLTAFSDAEIQVFLEIYRPTFSNNFNFIIVNFPKNLLRFPLFCKMCADLSDYTVVANATELYHAFLQRKCERLWMKKHGGYTLADGGKHEFEDQWKQYEEQLMYLAVSFLVHRKDRFGQRPYYPINRDTFVEAGIMRKSVDGRLVFEHRTFAEYFLAKWCFTNIKQQECAVIYREALLDKNLEFFLWTFDRMASKGRKLLELIVDGDENEVMLNSRLDVAEVDEAGRNALHLATVYSEPWTVVQRLCARVGPNQLQEEDDLLHWTPLHYALELGHWATAAALVKAGAELNKLDNLSTGKFDISQLKNWLPEYTLQKFLEQVQSTNRADTNSHLQQNQNKVGMRSSTVEMPESSNAHHHWVSTGSELQSNKLESTVKTRMSSEAERNNTQSNIIHEKSTNNSFKINEHPSSIETVTASHMTDPANVQQLKVHSGYSMDSAIHPDGCLSATEAKVASHTVKPLFEDDLLDQLFDKPQPGVQNGKSTFNGIPSNQHQNTAAAGPSCPLPVAKNNIAQQHAQHGNSVVSGLQPNKFPSTANVERASINNSPPHIHPGESTVWSLQSVIDQTTMTNVQSAEDGIYPGGNTIGTTSYQDSSTHEPHDFSILSFLCAIFCCSGPMCDFGSDDTDNTVTHFH